MSVFANLKEKWRVTKATESAKMKKMTFREKCLQVFYIQQKEL